jgi:hypothetical protein
MAAPARAKCRGNRSSTARRHRSRRATAQGREHGGARPSGSPTRTGPAATGGHGCPSGSGEPGSGEPGAAAALRWSPLAAAPAREAEPTRGGARVRPAPWQASS